MFYSQFILAKKGPLGTIWIAAHLERKLRKNQVADTDIGVSVDSIIFPEVPIALRLSSHLLLGVVRIYSRKVNYLFDDCSEALLKIKQAFRSTAVDLPPEESTAPYHSITLPETFDLDDFELPDNEIYQGNYVDHHVSTREQITLQDSMEGVVYATSQFGFDERFGDGDASQIGLDLDEELFMDNAKSQVRQEVSNCSPPQESNRIVTLLDMKDGFDEGMLEASEAIAMDFVDQTEVLAVITEFVEYAQAPCTPGLLEEPNRTSVQKAHEYDDLLEAEDHNVTDFVVEVDKVSKPSKPDSFSVGDNDSARTSRHDFDNGHLPIDLESKQVKSEILSTVSAFRHDQEDGIVVMDVHAINKSKDGCNGDFLSNKSTHCVDQMDVDCITEGQLNGSLTSGICSGDNDVEIRSGCNSPLHKSLASKGCLVDGQVSPKVSNDSEELVLPDKISDAVLPQESPMVCEVGNSEVPSIDDPSHNETSVSVACKEMSCGEKPVLRACNSVLKQHDTSSIRGEECHATDPMKLGLEKNDPSETALCGEADWKVSDEHLDNTRSCDNPLVNVNSSTTNELSAPERLLSAPDALFSPNNLLVDFSTPDKDIILGNTYGSDAIKPTSGKKRNFAESALTIHSLNSIESVGVARSKRTTGCIPDDDDLLSSILVGRKSSVLKMKPTPHVDEIKSMKRPSTAVRASTMKRKMLMDDSMVLHGDVIRQQLTSTEDIRRVRKKAPCTRPEISIIQRQFLEEEIFNETILSGMSGQMMLLQCETLNFSGVRVFDDCQKNAAEVGKESMPAVIPNLPEESRIGENKESAIIRNGTELLPADSSVQAEKGQVEELNLESRGFQTPVQETGISDVLELQIRPDHLQGEINNMEIERRNLEVTNLTVESTTYGLGFSSPRARDCSVDTEGPLLMDTSCFSSDMRSDFEHATDVSTGNHKEGLATNNLDHSDVGRDLFVNCLKTAVPHATIITEDDGCKSKQLLVGVTTEDAMRYDDTGFDDKYPTSSCMNDEVPRTSSSTVERNVDINGVKDMGCPESNDLSIMDAAALIVNHSTEEDPGNFENLVAGNDTEFLNVDDDEIAEDEEDDQFAEEPRFVENSGWSSRTRAVAKYLQTLFDDEAIKGKKVLAMDNLLVRKSRKEASRMFFETLVLKSRDYVQVEQAKPFDNINIKPREKLVKSIF